MKIIQCEQGTEAWLAARAGHATGSRMADIMAKGKSGAPSATRANYLSDLVSERLMGKPIDGKFQSQAMKDGNEREGTARSLYAFMHDVEVSQVGFVLHPSVVNSGCSPDGLVGTEGMVQFKCPYTTTHISWLLGSPIDGKYIKQVQWEMAVCERQWNDFVSYCPFLPEEMQLFTKRVHRDPVMIAEMEREVRTFLREVDETVEKLRKLYPSSTLEAA